MHRIKKLPVRLVTLALIFIIVLSSTVSYAAAAQGQQDYTNAVEKLEAWGVVDASDLNNNGKMTRELFAKVIINSTGNYELAQSMNGSTTYPDVSAKSKYCGYINAAAKLGYLSAYSDGKFKPGTPVTFAQLCTAMIKALGYTSADIAGAWPTGYLDKAKGLGLTAGYSYTSGSSVASDAAIIMIYRMLNTNIKKTGTQAADQTLLEASGLQEDQNNWVYGKPEIAMNFKPETMKLGSINFKTGVPVLRDTVNNAVSPASKVTGETISLNDIKDKDVVYEVYNKLNVLMYYLVVDNRIDGEITSILPSKYSPKKVQINSVDYDLGEYAKLNKFNSTGGSFNVGDTVGAVLGYDGKIVDVYYAENSTVEDYAFVVNTATEVSKKAADYGKTYYTVSLMHVDGTTKTYKISEDPGKYKWRLVKYSALADDFVALLSVSNNMSNELNIDRYEKRVGQSYATDNIKIFNYTDSTVSILKWTDIPNGTLPAGKVQYIGTTGDFGDVNLLLTSDLLYQQYKNYVVQKVTVPDGKKATTYTYNLVSGTDSYTYTSKSELSGVLVGSVVSMKMFNNKVSSYDKLVDTSAQGWYVQAIDSKRIKMSEWVYMFGSDVSFYVKDYSDNLTAKKLTDITVGTEAGYANVKLYCDRPLNNGGKVQYVIINMK